LAALLEAILAISNFHNNRSSYVVFAWCFRVVFSSIVTAAVTNTVVATIMAAELDQKVLEEQFFKRFKGYT
jgi:hypothetical protein